MKCPNCNEPIPDELIAKAFASKGGKTKGPTKARTRAQAKKAAKARWAKQPGKVLDAQFAKKPTRKRKL